MIPSLDGTRDATRIVYQLLPNPDPGTAPPTESTPEASSPRPPNPLSDLTIDEVRALQAQLVHRNGGSAVGRYQIIDDTLDGPVVRMGLTGREPFTPALQDREARVSVVHHETGGSRSKLRHLHRELHGRGASCGQIPAIRGATIQTRYHEIHAGLFAGLCERYAGPGMSRRLDIRAAVASASWRGSLAAIGRPPARQPGGGP